MKPVKIAALRPSSTLSLTIENILNKAGSTAQTASAQNDQRTEFILIAAEDITAAHRAKLLPYSIRFRPQDDLFERLVQLEKENRHLKSLSVTDELTGLYNKRFFNRQLTVEIARTQRTGEPFCLIFVDLDNFKIINDTLGHTKGDEFLVKTCRQITSNIRPTDFACRFGGDEFAIILPATSLRDGIKIAERWRKLFLQVATEMCLPVSSSIGIDEFNASCKLGAQEFLHQVDQFLYKAKKTGKGKIAHPDIELPESKAVTWAEKEILYHIFQPSAQKKSFRQKDRENSESKTKIFDRVIDQW
jgi:diguanylate cyclase (GGDEF)-like protein